MFEMIFGDQFQPFFLHEIQTTITLSALNRAMVFSQESTANSTFFASWVCWRTLFFAGTPGRLFAGFRAWKSHGQWHLPSGYVKIAIENDHL